MAQGGLIVKRCPRCCPVHHPQPLKTSGALWCLKDGGDALSSLPRNPALRSACTRDIPSVPSMEVPTLPAPATHVGPSIPGYLAALRLGLLPLCRARRMREGLMLPTPPSGRVSAFRGGQEESGRFRNSRAGEVPAVPPFGCPGTARRKVNPSGRTRGWS